MKSTLMTLSIKPLNLATAIFLYILTMSNTVASQALLTNPVCYGDPINLICDLSGCDVPGATFTWTNLSGSWTSNDANPDIIPGTGYATDRFYLHAEYSPPAGSFSAGSVNVVVFPEINLTANITPESCSNGDEACIDLSVSGGNPPYTYIWGNMATTEDICGLSAGTYCVTVTDANLCAITLCWTINDPDAI